MIPELLAEWVLYNRRGHAFQGYSKELIVKEILDSAGQEVFRIGLDEQGDITGMVCGNRNDFEKTIFIHDILTIRHGVLKQFMTYCFNKYPEYTVQGITRNGRFREFKNHKKLLGRII